jgi:hypothetical protein
MTPCNDPGLDYPSFLRAEMSQPEGYSDANWISDVGELYVMSGYVFILGGAAVS